MNEQDNIGEGNRKAGRRYRKDVRETVEQTTHDERAEEARDIEPEKLEELRDAERRAKKGGRQ